MIEKEDIHKLCETLAQTSTTLPTIEERKAYKQALDDVWTNVQSSKRDNTKAYYVVICKVNGNQSLVDITEDIDKAKESFGKEVESLKETESYKQADKNNIISSDEYFFFKRIQNDDDVTYSVGMNRFVH